MEKIKEKPTLSGHIKEKAVSAPKELLRRGLDNGAEQLRTQLRDAAQRGQTEGSGGDQIEDTAAEGVRHAKNTLLGQHRRKSAAQIRAQENNRSGGETGAVKTRDRYLQEQTGTAVTEQPKPQRQGQQTFIRERGRKAAGQRRAQALQTQRQSLQRVMPQDPGFAADSASKLSPQIRERRYSIAPGKKRPSTGRLVPGTQTGTAPKVRQIHQAASQTAWAAQTSAAKELTVQQVRYRQMAKGARLTAQKATRAARKALRAILAAVRSLYAALLAGGGVTISLVLVICLIGLLVASPFGIFFSGEDSGTGYTMPEAVSTLNQEFTDRIEQIKAEHPYDELDLDNAGNAAMIANWRDVLAIYAVKTTTDADSPDEVATLTEQKMTLLREIFWDMNDISYREETVSGGEDGEDTVILHITVTVKSAAQMANAYHFTTEQRKLLEELLQPEYQELFMSLTGSYQDVNLSPEEIAEIVKQLPANLSEARRQVVLTAYQLLGKVNYFWGGKSLVLGWDSRWGTPMKVSAAGSSSTGTVRPFGLDCSGFVDWVFYNQSGGQYIIGHGGGAASQHSYCTPISWSNAKPGDLVFYPGDTHVGIVCGFDSSGNIQIIHCASGYNNVVVTGKSGFTSIARPKYFAD